MTETSDRPTDRMAADRVADGPQDVPFKRAAQRRHAVEPADDDGYVTYEAAPPRVRNAEPARSPSADPEARQRGPRRAAVEHTRADLTPMDLHEMRLRLTAEPAEGRMAGPPRIRALRNRRKRGQVPWRALTVVVGGFLAIGAAVAVAIAWLPAIANEAESETAQPMILRPAMPADAPGR